VSVNYGLHGGAGLMIDAMKSVTDGYANSVTLQYTSLPQGSYSRSNTASYPEQDVQPPLFVVRQVTSTDGAGGTYTQTYSYNGLRKNIQGRGLESFLSVSTSDSRPGTPVTQAFFDTAFPTTAMPNKVDVYQHNGTTLMSRMVNTLDTVALDNTTNNQRTFPYVRVTTTEIHEVGGTKDSQLITTEQTTNTVDSYGNLTNEATVLTDNDAGSPNVNQQWSTTIASSFSPDTSNWCLGVPTSQSVTKSATGIASITRTKSQSVDYAHCRVTQQVIEPSSSSYRVTTDLLYDAFGNVGGVTTTGAGMTGRSTTVSWSDATHPTGQFPLSTTDPLGHVDTMEYDYDYGLLLSETDANGLKTSFQYDAFARRTLETQRDGTKTVLNYTLCSASPGTCPSPTDLRYWIQQIEQDPSGNALHETRQFFDGLDRPRFVQDQTLDGTFVYDIHRGYDALGRVSLEYVPSASESASYHAITYDDMGRPTLDALYINGAIDRQSSIAYAGRTMTTTDALGKQTVKTTDVEGNLVRSSDHDGYAQILAYDAFGNVTRVTDTLGTTLYTASYAYGLAAFLTATTDSDLGSWTYTPNALGDVEHYTDAKNVHFDATYDALSRPLTRV